VLKHVSHQLPVLPVVLHDSDRLVGRGLSGSVKVNVEPLPTSLVTPIRPPCSSTKPVW